METHPAHVRPELHSWALPKRWSMAGRAAALLLCAGMASSCLASLGISRYESARVKSGHIIEGVPFEKWLARNYCGPACLAMVLNYWDSGRSFGQRQIAADIYDSEAQVTYNSELVFYPRTRGFTSFSFQGDLRALKAIIAMDIPVIVLTKTIPQVNKGHYRVIVGFDEAKGRVIFHDPYFGPLCALTFRDFVKLWKFGEGLNKSCWAMAVVPEGQAFPFPSLSSQPLTSINLATAYYRRSQFAQSRLEWLKAKDRMSADPYPVYSLAMVSLKMGNAGEAESYALEAIKLDAKNAYAHDVLGLAYAKQGRIPEAVAALDQAVRLAPGESFIREHRRQVMALLQPPGSENDSRKGDKQ